MESALALQLHPIAQVLGPELVGIAQPSSAGGDVVRRAAAAADGLAAQLHTQLMAARGREVT